MNEDVLVYRINSTDTIIGVSGNWHAYADGNAWTGHWRPDDVVGQKLWDFIKGPETRHLYRELFRQVRGGRRCRPIPFRCDSPTERRFLELFLETLPGEQIEITSRIVRIERRSPVRLLETDTPRSKNFITICSMCKKIKMSQEQWVEIEAGLAHLRLFEDVEMPKLTHGLCFRCHQAILRELDEFSTPNNGIDSDEK